MDRVYVMQLVRSFQCGYLSRREFLQRASLVVGSTAAASLLAACGVAPTVPVPPQVVAPPVAPQPSRPMGMGEGVGIMDANVRYGEGDALMGYLARSMDNTGRNAVIVIQEWWGLNNHIRDVTRRFADQGFVALAPDLYNGVSTTEPDEARKLVMELDMMQAVQEIGQAAEFLLAQDYVIGEKVGVVGFCMGGGLALQTALNNADTIGASVAFYGRPLEVGDAARMAVPTLGLFGADDQASQPRRCRRWSRALWRRASRTRSRSIRVWGTPSSMMSGRATIRQQPAMRGTGRICGSAPSCKTCSFR